MSEQPSKPPNEAKPGPQHLDGDLALELLCHEALIAWNAGSHVPTRSAPLSGLRSIRGFRKTMGRDGICCCCIWTAEWEDSLDAAR